MELELHWCLLKRRKKGLILAGARSRQGWGIQAAWSREEGLTHAEVQNKRELLVEAQSKRELLVAVRNKQELLAEAQSKRELLVAAQSKQEELLRSEVPDQ